MKALVTGAAGFIGARLVRLLVREGHDVRALHLPNEDLRNLTSLGCERMAGDVTDVESLRRAMKGVEVVFHLAAIYALWLPRIERLYEVNVDGTAYVLRAAREAGVRRVVHCSSIARFGGQGRGRRATEASAFALGATGDHYSRSKARAHEVALAAARRGQDVVLVAPTGPIGPGDVGPTPTGRLLLASLKLPVAVVADTVTCFAHVDDMALGLLRGAERGVSGESYLIGAEDVALPDLARRALAIAGQRKPVVSLPPALAHAAARAALAWTERVTRKAPLLTPAAVEIARLGLAADCSKAQRELGLVPRPIDEALGDAIAWFRQQRYC